MPRNGAGVYNHPFPNVVEGTTIESAVFNGNTSDVEQDLNTPRPIVAGGTGASNAHDARVALNADVGSLAQVVTNYDMQVWESGSFSSFAGATSAPEASNHYTGVAQLLTGDQAYISIRATSVGTGASYVRTKNGGVWGAWVPQAGSVADGDARYVNVLGDTMEGSLTAVGALVSTGYVMSQNGTYYFDAAAAKYLNYDGASFNLVGGALSVPGGYTGGQVYASGTNNVIAGGSVYAGYPGTTGTYYFGSSGTKSLSYDGTYFSFSGGPLVVPSLYSSGMVAAGHGGATGIYYFGNGFGTKYLQYDGSNFNLVGGALLVPQLNSAGDIYAGSGATGTVRFSSDTSKFLHWNGSSFTLNGGDLNITSGINASSAISASNITTTGTIHSNTTISAGSDINAGGWLTSTTALKTYNWAGDPNNGIIFFNASNTYYINCVSNVFSFTGHIAAANITGAALTGTSTIQSNNGRIISNASDYPTVSTYATGRGTCDGFWTADRMYFGACGGDGSAISGWMDLIPSLFRFYQSDAQKAGGGPWNVYSDARIKNVLGDYTSGLEQIAGLQPVRYTYKGNDTDKPPSNSEMGAKEDPEADTRNTPTLPYPNSFHYEVAKREQEFIGLIAQPTELVMPEMVTNKVGFIDGQEVADLKGMDTGPLIFALINAVKELKARIEVLEAA